MVAGLHQQVVVVGDEVIGARRHSAMQVHAVVLVPARWCFAEWFNNRREPHHPGDPGGRGGERYAFAREELGNRLPTKRILVLSGNLGRDEEP